jgi:ectoine hydroxylase-related dioxygenase (phytanoyl-CoA dioxygenase family)
VTASVEGDGHDAMLAGLGVAPDLLSAAERATLDQDGYVAFPGLISPSWCQELVARVEELVAQEGKAAGTEHKQEDGAPRLANLANKGSVFDGIYANPTVLAVARHVIGRPFKIFSLNARNPLPGQGHQRLHADAPARLATEPYHIVNSLWMLDDMTEDNGATRVVPGSHRRPGAVTDYVDDPTLPHPEERLIIAPKGTVVAFNAHTWHGGTNNVSGARRWVLHVPFIDRSWPQQTDQRQYITDETRRRISLEARYLLDV